MSVMAGVARKHYRKVNDGQKCETCEHQRKAAASEEKPITMASGNAEQKEEAERKLKMGSASST